MWNLAPQLEPGLPLTRLTEPGYFHSLLAYPPIKALLPIPILAALVPVVWWFFRDTWRTVDAEEAEARLIAGPGPDYRAPACLVIVAIVLTLQEYYGGRQLYDSVWRPWLRDLEAGGWTWLQTQKFDELYSYASAQVFVEALKRAGRDLTRPKFIQALETVKDFTPATWMPVSFTSGSHEGNTLARVIMLEPNGVRRLLPFRYDVAE